ncbi:MAG: hypothetical protein AB8F94_03535 [Saprospiraceae bacterium]
MNLFESFYAGLYYSRKKEGMTVSGSPFSGNLLLAISLFMLTASILGMLALAFPSLGDAFSGLLKDTFGRKGGKRIGKIIAIFGVALFYPFVRYTVGTDYNYQKIIRSCDALSEEEFQKVAKKGTTFMGISLGIWVIPVAIVLIKTYA